MKKIALILALIITVTAFVSVVVSALAPAVTSTDVTQTDTTPTDASSADSESEVESKEVSSEAESSAEVSSEDEPSSEPMPDGAVFYGDVNKDGKVTSSDALACLQAAVNKITLTFSEITLADVNFDDAITSSDALAILQMSVKKIDNFDGKTYTDDVYKLAPTEADNGAYTPDKSADLSFVMDNTGLADKTVYYVAFTSGNALDTEGTAMLYAFQGLINRDFGRDGKHTSLLFFQKDNSDPSWYAYVTGKGKTFEGFTQHVIRKADDFYATFEKQLKHCGYILWDPNVPATSNVALTICGIEGYLPVMAGSALETKVKDWGMEEKMSLVGMFSNDAEAITGCNAKPTGSAKNDAYLWALEKYMPRCSDTYIAYTLDGAQRVPTNPISKVGNAALNCIENHDYIVARRAFVFDLYPYWDEAPCDDLEQTPGTDHETICKIFDARYKRANGKFGQLLGFPPWWAKYTRNAGNHPAFPVESNKLIGTKEATWIEWLFSEELTCYNLAKEADAAQPASMTNGSFYYKFRISKDIDLVNTEPWGDVYYKSSTHYFTLYLGDYDSSAWMKMFVFSYWMTQDRTQYEIPFMWAYNPNLSYRIPMAFDYIYSERTDYDYFVAGDSGAGYVIPAALESGKTLAYAGLNCRPEEYTDGFDAWADYCKLFYDRFDLSITGFIINGGNIMTPKILDCYVKFAPVGSFHNDSSQPALSYKGTPFIHLHNGVNASTSAKELYTYGFNRARINSGLNLSAFRTVCVSPKDINTIVTNYIEYAETRGKDIEYVDPFTFFEMARYQSGLVEVDPIS